MTNRTPEILDKFGHHMGRKPIYPWDEWTDGKIRELVQGIDFESEITSFRVLIHRTARKRGLKAKTRVTDVGIMVSFYKE